MVCLQLERAECVYGGGSEGLRLPYGVLVLVLDREGCYSKVSGVFVSLSVFTEVLR